jgi:hypothetical protein
MIMWMLSAGVRPYCDRPHDSQLIQEICSGARPNIVSETPPVFDRLMLQCLNAVPSNRPTSSQLYEILGNWVTAICDDPDPSDLSNQFDAAKEIKFSNLEQLHFNILPCHERAIYYSRPLNFLEPFLYGKMQNKSFNVTRIRYYLSLVCSLHRKFLSFPNFAIFVFFFSFVVIHEKSQNHKLNRNIIIYGKNSFRVLLCN